MKIDEGGNREVQSPRGHQNRDNGFGGSVH
jgi:hypothetical protein